MAGTTIRPLSWWAEAPPPTIVDIGALPNKIKMVYDGVTFVGEQSHSSTTDFMDLLNCAAHQATLAPAGHEFRVVAL